jgi:PAS domain S-box-containing protein
MPNASAATRNSNRWCGVQAVVAALHVVIRTEAKPSKLPALSEMSLAELTLKPRGRSWQRIPWFGGLFIAAIAAMAVWDIVRGYRVATDNTDRELETQARVIAEQTARSVQAVDVVLRHVAGEYKRGRLARLSPDELHHYLRELSVGLKQIDGFGLYDANGSAVARSWDPSDTTMRSIADLPGFHAMRADPHAELGIANVRRADDGVWALPLGRRLETPSGEFAGLIGARGLVSYFQDFYRDIRVNPGTKVTLQHRNGALLARYPPVEDSLGKRFPAIDATLAARGAGDAGPLRARSPIDGVERFAAVRAVPDYPLAVVVSRDVDTALAEWRAQAIGTALRTLALSLLAVLLLAVLARQLRRLDAAHESLQDSRERFALAVAGSDDGIWDWERDSDAIFASARARELYGLPPGPEMTPREAWLAQVQVHPDDVAPRLAAIEANMAGKTPLYEFEYRVRHPDGQYRWLRARGLCVRDSGGVALRMAGSVSDIDTRRRTEEALRVSEERFALAVAGSDVGVWDWDLRAGMAFESARAREIQGLPPGPELHPLDDLVASLRVHPDDAPLRAEGIRAHLAGETPAYEVDYRVRHDDGQYRWVRVRALCIRDAQGRPYRMAGSVVDIDAQRRAEETLRLSEERYAIAMTGSDEAHWVWNVKTDELFSTPQLHRLTGIDGEPPATRSEWRARVPMHPDDREGTQRAVDLHLAGLTPRLRAEYRIIDPASGEVRWIDSRGQCFRDADGRPDRLAGSTLDITERKRAEELLRESEERFARAVEGSNDGILDWDITNDRMFASERAMRIAGIDSDVVVRTHDEWLALLDIHPDDQPAVKQTFRRQPQGGLDAQEADCRVGQGDGSWRWVRIRGRHLGDLHGRATRWSGSISDIDAHKRTEQALRESQERYQLAVAGSNEGMWDWDMRNETFFLSARAQELLGLEPSEPMRPCQGWWRLFHYHPDDEKRVHDGLKAYLDGSSAAHWEVEYRLHHGRSDSWRWFRERGVALRDDKGRPYRMAGSLEDVTVRKNAEAERDRLESQLRQSQKLEAMGTLAGGIAHDFNNILAAILGYGEMLQRDCAEGTSQRRHVDAVMSAALRAKSLVERILAFSRSGVGERVRVNVQSVVDEALVATAASLPPQVRLERVLSADDAAVLGDATQIHQVVMNLCANAVQAMRAGGTLVVTLQTTHLTEGKCVSTTQLAPGGYVKLAVRDTGTGIAPQVLERIFDPFFTTKAAGMGTGLGLSLVHGIVADLGGGVDVYSRVGGGSTFTVYLPWHGSAQATEAQSDPIAGGSGETILLIDDEEALVRLGEEMMAELGYEPVGFASGAAALETFRDAPQRFDAVLSDEAMPEMTGSELARELRRIRPDIPIVLMSGYVTPALIDRAREIGIKDVLAKPLAAREIARSLADALHD